MTPIARRPAVRSDQGQSSVELALVLPVLALLLLVVLQVGLVARDVVVVTHAAREAARAAAVDVAPSAAAAAAGAASGLERERLRVRVQRRGPGDPVTVEVRYRVVGAVPIVGRWVHGRVIRATATMRDEGPEGPPRSARTRRNR